MKFFKHKIIILVLVLTSAMTSTLSMAAFTPAHNDVVNTKHNLSTGPGRIAVVGSVGGQVCIFCHTPHSSLKNGPLWNKSNMKTGAGVFKMYTSSASLTSIAKSSSLPANSPSLLCLSCHDGKTAMNILHNSSYGKSVTEAGLTANYNADDRVIPVDAGDNVASLMKEPQADMFGDGLTPEVRTGWGDSLTDDHPIGFSYSDAYDEKLTGGGGLHSPANVLLDNTVRLFGPKQRLECSSCHNPHLNYADEVERSQFLVKSNERSALCLTCHDK